MPTAPQPRRPGELAFHAVLLGVSLFLFVTAYRIAGFEALSSAGAVPMVTTGLMVLCSATVLAQSLAKSGLTGETLRRNILPLPVVATILMIGLYALALKPLGFLPTSFLFLFALIRLLSRRSLLWSAGLALVSVALIYGVFRLVFSVLMPAGIVPEAEILAVLRGLAGVGR